MPDAQSNHRYAPTDAFKSYLNAIAISECKRTIRRSDDTLRRELWGAATLDQYTSSGVFQILRDSLGAAVKAATNYRNQIEDTIIRISESRSAQGSRLDILYPLAVARVLQVWPEMPIPSPADIQRHLGISPAHAIELIRSMEGEVFSPVDHNGERQLLPKYERELRRPSP